MMIERINLPHYTRKGKKFQASHPQKTVILFIKTGIKGNFVTTEIFYSTLQKKRPKD